MIKRCEVCGENFYTDKPAAKTCSSCRELAEQQREAARYKTCEICGEQFYEAHASRYCPACRDEAYRRQQLECHARARAEARAGNTCEVCGKPLTEFRAGTKYCLDCRGKAHTERARERKRLLRASQSVERKVTCQKCGKEFLTSKSNAKYCPDCRDCRTGSSAQVVKTCEAKCEVCGKPLTEFRAGTKYCIDCRAEAYRQQASKHNAQLKSEAEAAGMSIKKYQLHLRYKPRPSEFGLTLDELARQANECNLDYGTYRAFLSQGKTFDELKAQAPFRHVPAHSHCGRDRKYDERF